MAGKVLFEVVPFYNFSLMGRSLNTRKSRQKHIERKILLKFTRKFDLKIIHLIKKKSNKLFFYANILTCLFHLRVNYIIAIIIIFKRSAIIVDIREVPAFNFKKKYKASFIS